MQPGVCPSGSKNMFWSQKNMFSNSMEAHSAWSVSIWLKKDESQKALFGFACLPARLLACLLVLACAFLCLLVLACACSCLFLFAFACSRLLFHAFACLLSCLFACLQKNMFFRTTLNLFCLSLNTFCLRLSPNLARKTSVQAARLRCCSPAWQTSELGSRAGHSSKGKQDIKETCGMNSSMHGNCQDDPRECRWRWGDIKDGRRQLDGTMKLGGGKRKQMGGGAGHAGIRNVGSERETRCR